ncbi:RIO kinase 2 [Nematocida parisii]|nr:RIO kinase 2 [Nematocida parisii]KAI5130596.1 RIO kinase 2 [Nematocida parisii]KAI5144081.1 RIO kinase 2 [Nematocida parisii]KAI5145557.1 RIO kinase 2 [Nematocida parisii]KAI5155430.1 RIO kinase 2 [Nematocida parisii]
MKFTCNQMQFLSGNHFRVLMAVEMGSKNHESVPVDLISKISNVNCDMAGIISDLVRQTFLKSIPSIETGYEGYALTYNGYDNLALYALQREGVIEGIANKIGVGKESDLFLGVSPEKKLLCVKIHKLGRVCFKAVKNTRDYHQKRKHTSWMYLSRLSAQKEYEYMTELYSKRLPMPRPYAQNRHIIVMEYLEGYTAMSKLQRSSKIIPAALKPTLYTIIDRLYEIGYVHGDFNEFNIMVRDDFKRVKIIDFPQMVKITDKKADDYLKRDKDAIETYFKHF